MRKIAAALLALCLTAGMATTVLANATAGEAQNNIDLINQVGDVVDHNQYDIAVDALRAINASATSASSVDWNSLYQNLRGPKSVDKYYDYSYSGPVEGLEDTISLVGANVAFLNTGLYNIGMEIDVSQTADKQFTMEVTATGYEWEYDEEAQEWKQITKTAQPSTPIFFEIRFPKGMYSAADKNTVSIKHIKADGTSETLSPVTLFVDNGQITGCVVVATSFSTYEMTIVPLPDDDDDDDNNETPIVGPTDPGNTDPIKDTSSTMGFTFAFGVLALAAASMGAATVYTRRKGRNNG